MLLRQRALLDSIDAQIYPPYARYPQYHPQYCFLRQRPERKPLEKEKVCDGHSDEERQLEKEEKYADREVYSSGLRGGRKEWGNAGSYGVGN